MAKKTARRKEGKHFLWSIIFMAITVAINIYLTNLSISMLGTLVCIQSVSLITSVAALVLLVHERNLHRVGIGFMWGSFFAALTLAFSIYLTAASQFALWQTLAMLFSSVALSLIVFEKHQG